MPAKAGIQARMRAGKGKDWIPAFETVDERIPRYRFWPQQTDDRDNSERSGGACPRSEMRARSGHKGRGYTDSRKSTVS